MPRGTEHPCPGCGRIVAYRFSTQYRGGFGGRGGGKPRVRHKCPHGTDCIFGVKTEGFNWPTCPACLVIARAQYKAAHRET